MKQRCKAEACADRSRELRSFVVGRASMARSSVGTSKLPFLSPTVCGQAPFAHVTMILADGSEE